MKIKFNHESESTMEAIGLDLTADELGKKMADISVEFLEGNGLRVSQLCEIIVNRLTDEEILYMCARQIYSTINQTLYEQMISELSIGKGNSLLN